ncbi:hypothetical protein DH20_09740 [Pantoea agglomerans]|nr:hypothetical protein [Pantoea agglomerans]
MFNFISNGMYPIIYDSYEKLLGHCSLDKTDNVYKDKVTGASILYPLLAVFCALYKLDSLSQELEDFSKEKTLT